MKQPILLERAQEVHHRPVEHEPGRQVVEEHDHHRVHHVHAARLPRVGRGETLRQEPRARHEQRQQADRESGDLEQLVGRREVVDPGHERGLAQLDRVPEHRVEREEQRHLDQHRQTAARRVHLVLPVERHEGGVHGLGVVLVLGPQAVHLGLEPLHGAHALHARHVERME